MNKLRESLFWKSTDSWYKNILISVRIYLDNFGVKIVNIVVSLVVWSPRTALRVNKVTMFKRFKFNRFKTNIKLEGTWWDSVGRVTWKIINLSNCIYNGTVRKGTLNNPNSLGMSCVFIIQFYSVLGGDKHRKVWHAMCDYNFCSSIFMKQHSIYYIKFWSRGNHQSSLKYLEVNI